VVLALVGKQTIAWAAPPKRPAGLEPVSVTIGEDAAGLGLEVAPADWTASGEPRREALADGIAGDLHADDGEEWPSVPPA
jgi:hypothetical protein